MELHIGKSEISAALEHTILYKGVTEEDIQYACMQAGNFGVGAVVVPVWHTAFAAKCLSGTGVKLVTSISFPTGAESYSCKLQQVKDALEAGADEIDVVPNFEMLCQGRYTEEYAGLREIVALAKPSMKVKINIEWGYFSDVQKKDILKMAVDCGADFVKVQHFLASGRAQLEEVMFIRSAVGSAIGIKIDGGIRTAEFCRELMLAGANRMGLTATFDIMKEVLNG
ncbi:MAG: deoxyribose-phosphate aldolase [Eubacteriales bacterium]